METEAERSTDDAAFLLAPSEIQEGLRLGGVGIWRWRIETDQLEWTRNLEQVHHLPPGSFNGTLSSFQRDLHPEDAEKVWQKIRAAIETGRPYRAVYRTTPQPGKPELWIETTGGITTGSDGSRYLTGVCLEVSERVRSEQRLKRQLLQQHAVARLGSFALEEGELQKVMDEAVRVAAEVLSVPLTKILQFADTADQLVLRAGMGWAEGLLGTATVGIDRESQAGYTLLANEPIIVFDLLAETRFSGPPLLHAHQVRSGISVVIPGIGSRPFGVFGIHARDVREFDSNDAEFLQSLANIVAGAARHAAAEDHRKLLVREMAHRAGNMLQLVTSIASQTFVIDADPDAARKSFSDRLNALARSNYVVARGGWALTSFKELVEEALKPFGDRLTTEGRNILLPPELCFDLGLVLHELATNCSKYGTFGSETGTVSVRWFVGRGSEERMTFNFVWDDPLSTVPMPQKGTGFGSKLISALIERKWNGVITVIDSPNFSFATEIPLPHFGSQPKDELKLILANYDQPEISSAAR